MIMLYLQCLYYVHVRMCSYDINGFQVLVKAHTRDQALSCYTLKQSHVLSVFTYDINFFVQILEKKFTIHN